MGAIVKGKVEKALIGAEGMNGLIVNRRNPGLVPSMRFADTVANSQRRSSARVRAFAEGLSVNLEKRQIRLTLKKTL